MSTDLPPEGGTIRSAGERGSADHPSCGSAMPNFAAGFSRASQTLKLGQAVPPNWADPPIRAAGLRCHAGDRGPRSFRKEQRHAAIPRRAGFPSRSADRCGLGRFRRVSRSGAAKRRGRRDLGAFVCHGRPPQHLLHLRRPDTRALRRVAARNRLPVSRIVEGPRPQSVFSSLKQLSEVPGCAAQARRGRATRSRRSRATRWRRSARVRRRASRGTAET